MFFALAAGEAALRLAGAAQRHMQERRNRITLAGRPGAYRIMCLGESTTAAGGDRALPAKLERILNERYPGTSFSVVNKAVSGADISFLVNSLEKNLDEVRPDMVITMMGVNDGAVRYYHGMDGSSPLFRHSSLYRCFRLMLDPRVVQFKTVPSVPPNTRVPDQEDPFPELLAGMKDTDGLGKRLRERLGRDPDDPKALYLLGRYLTSPSGGFSAGKPSPEGERLLLRAAGLAPGRSFIYQALGEYYQQTGRDTEAVAMMERSARLNGGLDRWYCLGRYCRHLGLAGKAEAALEKAVKFDKLYDDALFELVSLRVERKRYAEAEALLLKAAAPENEKVLQALAAFYAERGEPALAARYRKELGEKRALLTGRTRGYYERMAGVLRRRGVRLVCAQYPMCPLGPLRTLLADLPGIIYVDNEEIFRRAVEAGGSARYFCDLFGGNFGHFTEEGHLLLSRNVADSLAPWLEGGRPAGVPE